MRKRGTVPAAQAEFDAALVREMARYFDDPLGGVMALFRWGEDELKDWPDGPDEWQKEWLHALGEELRRGHDLAHALPAVRMATASGHGVGKSALVCMVVMWAMSTRPHLAGVVTANTADQLEKKTWRELALWHKRALTAHWFDWSATALKHVQHPESWIVSAIPWREEKPEAFAGLHAEHTMVIMDEASAIADKIWEVTEGAMTTAGALWLVFGNPTRTEGRFYECWHRYLHRWRQFIVDSRTAKAANQAQIAQWIEDYGEDSDFVRVRVRGMFPRTAAGQFIPGEAIAAAAGRELVQDEFEPLVMGVDVARFGDNDSVVRMRQGRDARTFPVHRWNGADTMETAQRIADIIGQWKPDKVFVDGGGVGGGVVDRLKMLGYGRVVVEVQPAEKPREPERFATKRVEQWNAMKDWLATGCIGDSDLRLVEQLSKQVYDMDPKGRVMFLDKNSARKRGIESPDDADALALTFSAKVARRDIGRRLRGTLQRVAQSAYDIFNHG